MIAFGTTVSWVLNSSHTTNTVHPFTTLDVSNVPVSISVSIKIALVLHRRGKNGGRCAPKWRSLCAKVEAPNHISYASRF